MTAYLLGIDVSTTTTNLNVAPDETQIDALLEAMTLEEQVSLLAGAGFWTTVPVERLGIPAIKVSDGPNGARGGGSLVGGVKAAALKAYSFDRAALGSRGLGYERLDQLTFELLLGTR